MKRPAVILVLAALLPVFAVLAAYLANVFAGDALEPRFVCNPYFDGCLSISRAARSGPGLHLFRAVMLPCAVLLFFSWLFVREWLTEVEACSRGRARTVLALGALGALFLVLYVTWLGTDGDLYRWLRRYGVTFYFAGTSFAQLLLLWVLWPQRNTLVRGILKRPVCVLAALVGAQWLLGVFSVVKSLLFSTPGLLSRVENIVEWLYALPMALAFLPIAMMLARTGLRVRYRLDRSVLFALVFSLFTLAGCSSHWSKPGVGADRPDADMKRCAERVAEQFPGAIMGSR